MIENGFAGMAGTLSCLDANYKIGSSTDTLQLTRYDPNPSGPPAPVEDTENTFGGGELSGLQGQEQPLSPLSDDVIDVLVLYQEPVRAALDPNGGRAQTFARAQLAVDDLQQAIDQSEADANAHLASVREVTRTSYGDIYSDWLWLQHDPEPMSLRDYWAADVVVYLTFNGGNAYGISQVPGMTAPPNPPVPPPGPDYAPEAVAVVQYNTAVFDETGGYPQEPYVFLHEFGHVIGANHNHEDAGNNTTPLEPGAYGYWRVNAKNGSERTIMSYATGQCLDGGDCTRIMYYANPDVTADWFRTGVVDYADNAKLFRDYWSYAAQYRTSLGRIFADGFEN